MSIAIVIPNQWEPDRLVYWSSTIARARGEDLLIIRSTRLATQRGRKKGHKPATEESPLAVALQEHAPDFTVTEQPIARKRKFKRTDKTAERKPCVHVKQLCHADLIESVQQEVRDAGISLLIVPRAQGVRFDEESFDKERQLLLKVPCETMQLRPGRNVVEPNRSIMVATSGSKYAAPALKLGADFAALKTELMTALYVAENENGSPCTSQIKKVDRSVKKVLKANAENVTRNSVVQDTIIDTDVSRGVTTYAKAKGHELVVLGAGRKQSENRRVPESLPERILAEIEEPTVVIVRTAMSAVGRVVQALENRKKSLIPQLERESRIELVERLQTSATWDFDFAFLLLLATLLASLGLALDSPAVVIGAMLVAPLMTPMVGVGLSVVQGNRQLAGKCMRTIARGILVVLGTGIAIGLVRILFASGLTNEISNRGAPGVLDLVAAFVSGIVAAYAFGRPHLLSVLPGIAIATALVPPVAAAGLALCTLNVNIALGAMLLFLSNFVAIILGSATVLWLVGMRGPREICAFTAWARRWMLGLFSGAVCLAIFFSIREQPAVASLGTDQATTEQSLPLTDPVEEPAEPSKRHTVLKPIPPESQAATPGTSRWEANADRRRVFLRRTLDLAEEISEIISEKELSADKDPLRGESLKRTD